VVEENVRLKKAGETFTNSLNMTFVYIPSGTFMMGSPEDEPGRFDNETFHEVTLTQGFYMQTTQVTQGQWKGVMGNNPSRFKDNDDCPIENVSWNNVQEFIGKIKEKEGKIYRLPTEAEWEYACRAGSKTQYYFGSSKKLLSEYAWHGNFFTIFGRTHPVATKKPNAWGLYDMHGNVCEWCEDLYSNYPSGSVTDPMGPSNGSYRVFRGGGWFSLARYCRSAYRNRWKPDYRDDYVGFRLLLKMS
jgi:formylglycine-generating enzyme required for sulfatase activity